MRVVCIVNTDPIIVAAPALEMRSRAGSGFSARELALADDITAEEALRELERLCESDWCYRFESDGGPFTIDEEWGIIRKSITPGREYEVLGISDDHYRILNEPEAQDAGNEPVLFHKSCFRIIDPTHPGFWVCETGDNGEMYYDPPGWGMPGFYGDFFDGVEAVQRRFWQELRKYYPETWREREKYLRFPGLQQTGGQTERKPE